MPEAHSHVHYCAWCGSSTAASSPTMLAPSCQACGCALKACDAREWPAIRESLREERPERVVRGDGMWPIVALTAGPWLLPILGVELGDVAFALPAVLLAFAATRCFALPPAAPGGRPAWRAFGAAASAGAAACVVSVAGSVLDRDLRAVTILGLVAVLLFLLGLGHYAAPRLRAAPRERILDGILVVVLVVATGFFFGVEPGLQAGEGLRALIVGIDLGVFALAGVAAVADPHDRSRAVARWLWVVAGCLLATHAVSLASALGAIGDARWVLAALVGVGGLALATAAVRARPRLEPLSATPRTQSRRAWLAVRVLAPMSALLLLPVVGVAAVAAGHDAIWAGAWFGGAFVLALALTFHRQAHLMLDHRRAVLDERARREEMTRRNEELEALTGLATTMTQTLEEAPIVEQALSVLHLAARASSSALHLHHGDGRLKLRATCGDWQSEHPWADGASFVEGAPYVTRGGRQITRLPLGARGHEIGTVTLVRPGKSPLRERDLELLKLLVDQMAMAVQNARDYRERLEQAVRDPLTGIYNRRYFFEALEKEVQRARRYGSPMSLVLFDVDDFKRVNDTLGHAAGDDVLRGIAREIESVLRPTDSCARIGGEEFALLLPETEELDALIVAERVRAAVSRARILEGQKVTLSGGVGSSPAHGLDREALVKRIDDALYWAKRNGKDMCALVSEATDAAEAHGSGPDDALAHLTTLVGAIDAQHLHTRDHSENVALYSVAIGRALGLEQDHLLRLRRAAMLHDIGKVAVRPEVLEKPGRLDAAEYAEIKLHPAVGATMLRHAGLVQEAAWVRHHHERVDGAGYPDGLTGAAIPLEARIIFVADSFEAMTSDRPYSPGMDTADALAELRRCAGTQFDPVSVDAFCRLVERGELEAAPLRDGPAAAPAPGA